MYYRNEYSLAEAIQLFLKKYNYSSNESFQKVQMGQIWRKAMGKIIAQYTTKVILQNDTLIVYISNPIVKHDLLYNQSKAINLINEQLGNNKIKTLKIR